MSVDAKVKEIVSDQLDTPKDDISSESSFVDDLKADSLDIVELVMTLEETFDIEIPDDDAEKMQTINDAIGYLKERVDD